MDQPAHKLRSSQRMADAILRSQGTTLTDFLTEHRGNGESYEQIGTELSLATNGAVRMSYQTVKNWLIELEIIEEAS